MKGREPENARTSRRARRGVLAACAALVTLFALLSWTSVERKSPTIDEPMHLTAAWTIARQRDFRDDPENPPLWQYWAVAALPPDALHPDLDSPMWRALPAHLPVETEFGTYTAYETPGADIDAVFARARATMLVLGAALAALVAGWAWKLAGPVAAVAAAAAFCLDPTFLAHAPLLKNDVPLALASVALVAAVWAVGRRATVARLAAAGLLCGVVLGIKFSAVLMGPIVAALLLARAVLPEPWPVLGRALVGRGAKLLAAGGMLTAFAVAAYAVVWASYGFRFGPSPDPSVRLDMASVVKLTARWDCAARHPGTESQAEIDAWRPTPTTRVVLWAERHRLLPEAWLVGFQYSYATTLARWSYLCGEYSLTGWWYYFPLAMLFKTPAATLAAFALTAVVAALVLRRRRRRRERAWDALCVAAPPVVLLLSAMKGHIDIGIRHLLPAYAFLFVAVGCAAAAAYRRRPRATVWTGCILAAALAAESLGAWPDYIPFFNAFVGGPRNGLHLLADSNLDWGQDLPAVAQWQQAHPADPLYLCYFGRVDPRHYGIRYLNLSGSQAPGPAVGTEPRGPGVIAISATHLAGVYLNAGQREAYGRLWRGQQPIDVLGGSIYLYRWPPTNGPGGEFQVGRR